MRASKSRHSYSETKAGPLRSCLKWFTALKQPVRVGVLILLAIAMVVAGPARLANATPTNNLSAVDQAKSFAYYKALRACMAAGFYKDFGSINAALVTHMSQQDAINFDWFNGRSGLAGVSTNGTNVGAFNDPRGTSGDGSQNCGDSEGRTWIKAAAALWGYTGTSSDGPNLLCQLGFTREQSGVACNDTTAGANNDFIAPGGLTDPGKGPSNLDDFWKGWLESGSTDIGSITPNGGAYRLYLDNLKSQCRLSPGGSDYTIQEFPNNSKTPVATKYGAADRDRGPDYQVTIYEGTQMSCRDIANKISDPNSDVVLGYVNFIKSGGSDANPGGTDCSQAQDKTQCDTGQSSCRITGVGWIICPTVNFLAGVADSAYKFLSDNFLSVSPQLFDIGGPTFQVWTKFLSVANVILVIAFIVIIYSQLTGTGVSNYGIKRMLPRLVMVAILMNVSYFICQAAIDLSNILGYSLKDFLSGVVSNPGVTNHVVPTSSTGADWTGIAGTTLLAGAATGTAVAAAGGVTLAVVALIASLVGIVITLIVVFFILVLREILVVLLVVIAPIAFVAYLLPNTNQWFERWRKLFTDLLLVFPVIGLIYGASTLASKIITATYQTTDNSIAQIIGGVVLILPLILIPLVLKGAINGVGKLAGFVNGAGGRLSGGAQKGFVGVYKGSNWNKFHEAKKADRLARIGTGGYRGAGGNLNPRNWVSGANRSLNRSNAFNTITGGYGAQRDLVGQGQNRKDSQEAMAMFNNDDGLMKAWAQDGGNKGANYAALSSVQQQQFERLRQAGHHRKATSFAAVAEYISENGKGDMTTLQSALASAKANGSSDTELSSMVESARAAYRKSGRGDILGAMKAHETANGGNLLGSVKASALAQQAEMKKAWNEVGASSVHREALSSAEGLSSYESYLNADVENTRKALAGFDGMEARAQEKARQAIIDAADRRSVAATGNRIGNIQDAKTYFGVK